MFQLCKKAPRWIVFCSSMRKKNVTEVRRKAPHSSSQRTHLKKEERRHSEQRRPKKYNQISPTPIRADLKTFMASVANGNKTVKTAVLLDVGSSDTFCTLNLAQKLQLPTASHQRLSFHTLDLKTKPTDATTLAMSR